MNKQELIIGNKYKLLTNLSSPCGTFEKNITLVITEIDNKEGVIMAYAFSDKVKYEYAFAKIDFINAI